MSLKDDFLCLGKIDSDLCLYEIMDPNTRSAPKQQLMLKLSKIELVLVANILREPILRKHSQ